MNNIGIVSPGNMGCTIAMSMISNGNNVYWTSENRSQETIDRASSLEGLSELKTISELFDMCNIVFCIGRGGVAEETIRLAAKNKYKGIYVEGNNLHGERSELEIRNAAQSAGIDYVEALFRGFPLGYSQGGGEDKRELYLSGEQNSTGIIESLFSDGIWKVKIVEESAKSLNRSQFKRLF
jgi:3-hydroxyisobutyrate dehydrogenase-like beta-hydroxyacid dehydrogenase